MRTIEVAMAFVRAINHHDVELLCELMADDHLLIDSGGRECRGREATRSGWRGYFAMVPDYAIDVKEAVADGPLVILVGTARGTYSPSGGVGPDGRWSTPAAWRAVVAHGQVAVWQVFADNEPLRRIMRRHGKEPA